MRREQVLKELMHARQALLAVFACRNATVHEEAMLAAGALTYACGPQFVKYMERFFPVLQMGLTNHQARRCTRRHGHDMEACLGVAA